MKKVMIVDDSLIIRMSLKKIFTSNGFDVVAEASNGQEAVDKFIEFKPDVTTLDITMPVLDGIEALKMINSIDANANVIMISALGQELKIVEALKNGASHYIVKPFQEKDVLNKVGSLVASNV